MYLTGQNRFKMSDFTTHAELYFSTLIDYQCSGSPFILQLLLTQLNDSIERIDYI